MSPSATPATGTSMSPSATPATQSAAALGRLTAAKLATRASPVPQVPRLPRQTQVDVAKCHACHANGTSMSPSATPATHSAAAPRATNSDQARHQRRPSAHVSVFPGCHPWFSSHGQYPVSAVPRLQLYRIPLISFLSLDSACKLCSVLMLCPGRVESKTKTLRGGVTQLLHFTVIKGSGGGELRRNLRLKKDKKEGGWWWPAEERDLANLIGMSKEKGGVVHPFTLLLPGQSNGEPSVYFQTDVFPIAVFSVRSLSSFIIPICTFRS